MNVKKLNEMISGDSGKVIVIKGKAGIHRQLLKFGITAGRIIYVLSRNTSTTGSTLTVMIDNNIHSLNYDVAAGIKIDLRC